jgi:hypothetical protein
LKRRAALPIAPPRLDKAFEKSLNFVDMEAGLLVEAQANAATIPLPPLNGAEIVGNRCGTCR